MTGFDNILTEFHKLKPDYQTLSSASRRKWVTVWPTIFWTKNFNTNGVDTVADYDLYCHYVAGLVGEGLTDLMVLAKFADSDVLTDNYQLSNSMGLFLQKVNIIRDYYEDLEDGRSFYPREIWLKYTDSLPNFHKNAKDHAAGVACINDLVLNALAMPPTC